MFIAEFEKVAKTFNEKMYDMHLEAWNKKKDAGPRHLLGLMKNPWHKMSRSEFEKQYKHHYPDNAPKGRE